MSEVGNEATKILCQRQLNWCLFLNIYYINQISDMVVIDLQACFFNKIVCIQFCFIQFQLQNKEYHYSILKSVKLRDLILYKHKKRKQFMNKQVVIETHDIKYIVHL